MVRRASQRGIFRLSLNDMKRYLQVDGDILQWCIDRYNSKFIHRIISIDTVSMVISVLPTTKQKSLSIEHYLGVIDSEIIDNVRLDDLVINTIVDVSRLDLRQRINILERSIVRYYIEGQSEDSLSKKVVTLFQGSIVCLDGQWYHTLSSKSSDDHYSYTIASHKLNYERLRTFTGGRWQFNKQQEIIPLIASFNRSYIEAATRKFSGGLYLIYSSGDNGFRLRDTIEESSSLLGSSTRSTTASSKDGPVAPNKGGREGKAPVAHLLVGRDGPINKRDGPTNNQIKEDGRRIYRGRRLDSYSLRNLRSVYMRLLQRHPHRLVRLSNRTVIPQNTLIEFMVNRNLYFKDPINNQTVSLAKSDIVRLVSSGSHYFNVVYNIFRYGRMTLISMIINLMTEEDECVVF